MYVIVFRDQVQQIQGVVGPWPTKEEAGSYARQVYRATAGRIAWSVWPMLPVSTPPEVMPYVSRETGQS